MTGSEIAILFVAIMYWIGDVYRLASMPGTEGGKLFIGGVRLVMYAGFICWFISGHWN